MDEGQALWVGFAAYFAKRICEQPAVAASVAALLVDSRWPWAPTQTRFGLTTDFTKSTRMKKLAGESGRDTIAAAIGDPRYRVVEMYRSTTEVDNHSHLVLDTGRGMYSARMPFEVDGQTRGHELPARATIAAWIELVHELVGLLDVGCGVLPVWSTSTRCLCDCSRSNVLNKEGLPADTLAQNRAVAGIRDELGAAYVRHPRWGTYLRREHVERIGGLAAIRERVQPAQLRELGELVYIQLTEAPVLRSEPACEGRLRELEALMAPILPP